MMGFLVKRVDLDTGHAHRENTSCEDEGRDQGGEAEVKECQ